MTRQFVYVYIMKVSPAPRGPTSCKVQSCLCKKLVVNCQNSACMRVRRICMCVYVCTWARARAANWEIVSSLVSFISEPIITIPSAPGVQLLSPTFSLMLLVQWRRLLNTGRMSVTCKLTLSRCPNSQCWYKCTKKPQPLLNALKLSAWGLIKVNLSSLVCDWVMGDR